MKDRFHTINCTDGYFCGQSATGSKQEGYRHRSALMFLTFEMPSRIPGSPGGAATPYAHPTGSYLNTTGTFEKSLGVSLIAVQWPGPLSYVFSLL